MVAFSLSLFRKFVFITCSVFSVIVIGIAADLTNLKTHLFYSVYWAFVQSLSVATAVLTLLTLPTMLIVELKWPQASVYTSMVVAELGWLFILWVLWVATASRSSAINIILSYDCSVIYGGSGCTETQAIEAFAFINWLLLLGYSLAVLSFSVRSALNGRRVWFVSVREVTWWPEKGGVISSPVPVSTGTGPMTASHGYPLHDQGNQAGQHSPV